MRSVALLKAANGVQGAVAVDIPWGIGRTFPLNLGC